MSQDKNSVVVQVRNGVAINVTSAGGVSGPGVSPYPEEDKITLVEEPEEERERRERKKLIAEADLKVAKMVEAQLSKQLQEQLRRQDDARRKVRDLKAKIAELEDELEHARNSLRQAQGLHTVYLEAHREAYTELRRLIDEENPNE